MRKLRSPVIHSYDGISEPKYRLFIWACPYCNDKNGETIGFESTEKDVECGSCGAQWHLGIEWVDDE